MKNLLACLAICLFICSCKNAPEAPKEPEVVLTLEEQLEKRIEEELASGKQIDTIILDNVFGMSRMDVFRQKNKLVKEKKVYGIYKTKNTRIFVYDLNLKSGKTMTYFDTFYHKDELYRIECKPKITGENSAASIWNEVVALFSRKYGKPDFTMPASKEFYCDEAIWIDGNLKITIDCDGKETMITYLDMQREIDSLGDI